MCIVEQKMTEYYLLQSHVYCRAENDGIPFAAKPCLLHVEQKMSEYYLLQSRVYCRAENYKNTICCKAMPIVEQKMIEYLLLQSHVYCRAENVRIPFAAKPCLL